MFKGRALTKSSKSGPNTFSDGTDLTALQFPQKLPSPSDMAGQLKAAQDAASSAQTFAYLALVRACSV